MSYYSIKTIDGKLNGMNKNEISDKYAFEQLKLLVDYYRNFCERGEDEKKVSGWFITGEESYYSTNSQKHGLHARWRLILEKLFPNITEKGFHVNSLYDNEIKDLSFGKDLNLLHIPKNGEMVWWTNEKIDNWNKEKVDKLIEHSCTISLKKRFSSPLSCNILQEEQIFNLIAFLDLKNLIKVAPLLKSEIEKIIEADKKFHKKLTIEDPNDIDSLLFFEDNVKLLKNIKKDLEETFPEIVEDNILNKK